MSRADRLEDVAYWAKQALCRRELYEQVKFRHPDETAEEIVIRREELWKQIKSADAMVKVNLNILEREHGPVFLGRPPELGA